MKSSAWFLLLFTVEREVTMQYIEAMVVTSQQERAPVINP